MMISSLIKVSESRHEKHTESILPSKNLHKCGKKTMLFLLLFRVRFIFSKIHVYTVRLQKRLRPASNFVKKEWEDVGDVFIENESIKLKAGVSPEYPFGLYLDFISMFIY